MLTVHSFAFNPFSENTYVVSDENQTCIVVDPGCYTPQEKKQLLDYINDHKLTVEKIVLTHTHIDHVLGLQYAKNTFQVPIYAHSKGVLGLEMTERVGKLYGIPVELPPPIDRFLEEGDLLNVGKEETKVLFCPGHAPDHIVLYSKSSGLALVGDVIFYESIGRTDLPGGNYDELIEMIRTKIFMLPLDTELFPGHGPSTFVSHEINHNPFLK